MTDEQLPSSADPLEFLPEARPLPPSVNPLVFLPKAPALPAAIDPYDRPPKAPRPTPSRGTLPDADWRRQVFFDIDPLDSERDARLVARRWNALCQLIKIQDAAGRVFEAEDGFRYEFVDGWSYHYRAPGRYLILRPSDDGDGFKREHEGIGSSEIAQFRPLDIDELVGVTQAEHEAFKARHNFSFLPDGSHTAMSVSAVSIMLFSHGNAGPTWVFVTGVQRTAVPAQRPLRGATEVSAVEELPWRAVGPSGGLAGKLLAEWTVSNT